MSHLWIPPSEKGITVYVSAWLEESIHILNLISSYRWTRWRLLEFIESVHTSDRDLAQPAPRGSSFFHVNLSTDEDINLTLDELLLFWAT